MLSLPEIKIKNIFLLALAALFLLAPPAPAAQKIEFLNGDIKKGGVSLRVNGMVREMAIDETASLLGLAAGGDGSSLLFTVKGKKLEFWKDSNIVRTDGKIISFPTPIAAEGGHWWGEGRSLLAAFNGLYTAAGEKPAFRWGAEITVAASQPPSAKARAAVKPETEPKTKKLTADVQKPVSKEQTKAKTSAPAKETPKTSAQSQPAQSAPPAQTPQKTDGAQAPRPARARRKPIVVVDAGHGGHDPGASANKVREKDINLKAATTLAKILKEKGADARLTRSTDVYLKLAERTAFANENKADVFISLHCNSMPKGHSGVAGFEIYIMALPSDKDAMNLAIAENKEISGDASTAAEVEKADRKTRLLLKILGDMQQNDKIGESTALTEVLHSNAKKAGLPMRKVAQAPFFVLRGAGMPAVLVEMGYLTNAAEAQRLNSAAYREKMCRSLAEGIMSYIETHRPR